MRILGIDTATSTASVAVIANGALVAEETYPPAETATSFCSFSKNGNHAEIILPLIDCVLKRSRVSLCELAGLAVSVGPGSFTGLRIGLSTVKGLAYGWDIPVFGVSTLLANASRATTWNGLICSLLDARKNEVYAAVFLKNGLELKRLTEDHIAGVHSVIQTIRSMNSKDCLFVGEGCKRYGQLVADALGATAHLNSGSGLPSVATAVAHLGEEQLRRNEAQFVGDLLPIYLRRPEAQLSRKDTMQLIDIV